MRDDNEFSTSIAGHTITVIIQYKAPLDYNEAMYGLRVPNHEIYVGDKDAVSMDLLPEIMAFVKECEERYEERLQDRFSA